jgi:transcription-repair coupling factor (superfamily II helicase)
MLDTILKQTLGVVNPLIDKINPNAAAKAQLNHCAGSLDAIVISQLFERTRKTIFCVFPDFEKAQFFKGDLESLGLATSTLFPPTFVKPYSSNHIQDLHFAVSRAEAVEAIAEKPNQIWVCSADAIAELVNTGGSVLDKRIQLEANQSISMDTLAESLVDIGYEPVNFVNAPGEFARRGGIVDVFPYSANYPVRLEFFGDEVDSIREFDVDNQRSIAFLNDTRFIPNVTKNDSDGIYQSFTDLAPAGSFLYIVDPNFVDATIEAKYEEAISAYDEILADKDDQRDLPVPEIRYLMPEKWTALQEQFSVLLNGSSKEKNLAQLAFKAKPQPDLIGTI